jgi:hypothetical protein
MADFAIGVSRGEWQHAAWFKDTQAGAQHSHHPLRAVKGVSGSATGIMCIVVTAGCFATTDAPGSGLTLPAITCRSGRRPDFRNRLRAVGPL